MWVNWAGDQRCEPAVLGRARTVPEVLDAIRRAREAGLGLRAAGTGHSFTDAALTGGVLVDVRGLSGLLDADPASGLVRFAAGTTLREAGAHLAALGLAFDNLGDIDAQTLAGAISTGTHGTGARLPNLAAQVTEIELATADGALVRCSAQEDPEAWRAARVAVGALGVITAVTVRAVPAFTLRRDDRAEPLGRVLDELDERAGAARHFELFTFPYSGVALTRTTDRVDGPPEPPGRARRWLQDVALVNGGLALASGLGRRAQRLVPALNRAVTRAAGSAVRVDRSDRCFASPRLVRFTEMEYAVPREAAADLLRGALEIVEAGRLPVSFPLELRFSAGDDAFLSPAHGRDTAYVAVHAYRGMPWGWFREVERLAIALGGRPHWGKRHLQTAATLAPRYPAWDRFQAVRARLDPEGLFQNAYTERVLGPVRAPAAAADPAADPDPDPDPAADPDAAAARGGSLPVGQVDRKRPTPEGGGEVRGSSDPRPGRSAPSR